LLIERYLAAEFGTRLAAFSVYVFFAIGGWFTSWIGAALVDLVICFFHQIVMISVIEFRRVVGLVDLHGVNV